MAKTSRPPSTLTLPVRCSTVTPGKFATFWRRPVSRLNKVDLPELGGPTIATTCRRVGVGGVGSVATGQAWQSLMVLGSLLLKDKSYRRFTPKCDLSSIHPEDARIAARRRKASRH